MHESSYLEEDHGALGCRDMEIAKELLGLDSVHTKSITSTQVVLAAQIKLRVLRRELSVALADVHLPKDSVSRSYISSSLPPARVWQRIRCIQAARDRLLSLHERIHADGVIS
jgi:hypothetical protein